MFSKILKELRIQKGLTQKQLANIIGVETSSVGKYEGKGGTLPSDDVKLKIAEYFGVSMDYLFGRNDLHDTDIQMNIGILSPDEINLIQNYRNLNAQGKEYIRQTMYMAATIYIKHSDIPNMEDKRIG